MFCEQNLHLVWLEMDLFVMCFDEIQTYFNGWNELYTFAITLIIIFSHAKINK